MICVILHVIGQYARQYRSDLVYPDIVGLLAGPMSVAGTLQKFLCAPRHCFSAGRASEQSGDSIRSCDRVVTVTHILFFLFAHSLLNTLPQFIIYDGLVGAFCYYGVGIVVITAGLPGRCPADIAVINRISQPIFNSAVLDHISALGADPDIVEPFRYAAEGSAG